MTVLDRDHRPAEGRGDGEIPGRPSAVPGGGGRATAAGRRATGGGVRRRTVRMRLALAYGALFLVCGAALLGISYFFVVRFPFDSTVHLTPRGDTASAGPRNVVHLSLPTGVPAPSGATKSPPPGYGVSAGTVHAAA
ncbi:MAG: hypothetical protein FWC87_11890, partial [Acidimicrobiaceae bacterium]|nr:hypothetical protein [Acidimicrobiaceae bacterium]